MRTLQKSRASFILLVILCMTCASGQVSLVSSSGLSASHHSQARQTCGPSAQINVVPNLPTQDDHVQVIASGEWYDTCIPLYQSHQIDNHLIRVDAIVDYPPDTGCADMITPWEFMVDIGELSAGSYEVNLYITDVFNQVPIPTTLCATKHFMVFPELNKTYLPFIAKQITAQPF